MQKRPRLAALSAQISSRLERLMAIERDLRGTASPSRNRLAGYIAVDALSAWSSFSREYALSCLWLNAVSEACGPIQHSDPDAHRSERDALISIIRLSRGKPGWTPDAARTITPLDEPPWRKAETLLLIAQRLAFSNLQQINLAFSIPGDALKSLPDVRNFYAHKGRDTFEVVKKLARENYSVPTLNCATDLITTILPKRTDTLLNEWLHQLRNISRSLCA